MWIYEALRGVELLETTRSATDITGVHYDSRQVKPGDAFVAFAGGSTDGNRFLADAIERGARAVVTDSRTAWESARAQWPRVPFYLAANGRRALAGLAANFFEHPERSLAVSAVTGTNGKTTTAFLLEQMLRSVGRQCVLIGTIETHIGRQVRPSEHTTPESRDLLALFADGVRIGATEAVMEMSSHALEQERVWGVQVDVALFTNLTQDHLDYHRTMDAYAAAKAKLFAGVGTAPPRVAAINLDDSYAPAMQQAAAGVRQLWTYGFGESSRAADFRAEDVDVQAGATSFTLKTPFGSVAIQSPLTGFVNVSNLLAASCAALARGLTLEQIAQSAAQLRQVPGRFETIPTPLGFTVVVDYAHTDDALRNLIGLARKLVAPSGGRVLTLFGCGGDRDRGKRPRMGRAAGEGSDLVVLTSDNPRSEDPESILAEALAGVRETQTECIVESDRAQAIALALRAARPGDIVLIAGKGHEKVQITREGTRPFDDVAVAAAALKEIA